MSNCCRHLLFNPIPMVLQVDNASTHTRVSNVTVSLSSTVEPALLHITPRANMHVFDNDHDYCEESPADHSGYSEEHLM